MHIVYRNVKHAPAMRIINTISTIDITVNTPCKFFFKIFGPPKAEEAKGE